MVVSERARHELYEQARRSLGDDGADTLMELLPPVGWGDIATRRDLDVLRAEVHADIAGFREDVSTQLAGMHAEIAGVRTEIASVRGESNAGLAELRSVLENRLRAQTLTIVTTLIGVGGLLLAVGKLL